MKKEKVIKINSLISAPYNPRYISREELEFLKESIKKFGLRKGIVVNTHPDRKNIIIGGNQTVQALKELGWTEISVEKVDFISLPELEEKALNLALNKISGEWDELKLMEIIHEFNIKHKNLLKNTGFTDSEVQRLLVEHSLEHSIDENKEKVLKTLFDTHQTVPIFVDKTGASVRKDRIAFYTRTMEEFETIKNTFLPQKPGELDIDKLLEMIKSYYGK